MGTVSALAVAAGSSSTLVTWLSICSPFLVTAFGCWLTWRLRGVHKLVNEAATIQSERNAQLIAALKDAGIAVPDPTQKTGPAS